MIPVNRPVLDGREKQYLNECIDTGWISSEGPFVSRLEDCFVRLTGKKHGVAVCNGSAALDLALSALDLMPGDEVILPSFSIISCVQSILRCGATPVPVDCDTITWNMGIDTIASAVNERTRAILIVHTYGLPCDMDPIIEFAESRGILLIEDAAEAHGVRYKGKTCGGFGMVSTFSFYPNKLVTTGEGGIVLTDDDYLAERLRRRRNLSFSKRRFVHEELGWNMRMSNLQAAVGCAQFERLDEFIGRKKEIGSFYNKAFAGTKGITLPCPKTSYADNMYWVFGILLDANFPIDAFEFIQRLERRGIGARPFFWPTHLQPVLQRMGLFADMSLPVSEHLGNSGFYIPSGVGNSDRELETAATAVLDIVGSL